MSHFGFYRTSTSTTSLLDLSPESAEPAHASGGAADPPVDEPTQLQLQAQPQPALQTLWRWLSPASPSSHAAESSGSAQPSALQPSNQAMSDVQGQQADESRGKQQAARPLADASSQPQSTSQPPTSHAIASSSTAAAFSSHASPAAATPTPTPTFASLAGSQRCFTDGLVLVFAHLTLPELLAAARACHSWRHAGLRVRCLGFTMMDACERRDMDAASRVHAVPHMCSLSQSPFRHHVTELAHSEQVDGQSEVEGAWRYIHLQLLASLPSLRRMDGMRIKRGGVEDQLYSYLQPALRLPASLAVASLQFVSSCNNAPSNADCAGVIRALAECSMLTELELTAIEDRDWDLAPLGRLQQLTKLTLRGDPDRHFTSNELNAVKQLASLRSLTLLRPDMDWEVEDPLGPQWLPALCTPPHRLQQLERLSLQDIYLFDEAIQVLMDLPTLTALDPAFISVAALPHLAFFTALRELHVPFEPQMDADFNEELPWEDIEDAHGLIPAPLLLDHLTCAGLRSLHVDSCSFTEEQAATLFRLLPELTELHLSDAIWPSLHSLAQATKLERFQLRHASQPPFSLQLAHVSALPRSLRHLHLGGTQSLDAALVAHLRTPSKLLPALQEFTYQPRAAHGQ